MISSIIPIGYSLRFDLRDRLTVRSLPLHTNPWAYGDNVLKALFIVTHVSILTSDTSSLSNDKLSQAYRTFRYAVILITVAASVDFLSLSTSSVLNG